VAYIEGRRWVWLSLLGGWVVKRRGLTNMMKVLCAPMVGGRGIGPMTRCAAIAESALASGMKVAFCCQSTSVAMASAIVPNVFTITEPRRRNDVEMSDCITWSDVAVALGLMDASFLDASIDEYLRAIDVFDPDVMFTECTVSACVAASMAGIPLVTSVSWPDCAEFADSGLREMRFAQAERNAALNAYLARNGNAQVSDVSDLLCNRASLCLIPSIPELQPELVDASDKEFVGELLYQSLITGPLPDVLERETGRLIVYAYLSTSDDDLEMLTELLNAIAANDRFLVVCSVSNAFQGKLVGSIDARVVVGSRWPALSLLRKCCLAIYPGTANTMITALLAGVPSLLIPGNDTERKYNSRNLERLGAGLTCDIHAMEALGPLVAELVDNGQYRLRAAGLGMRVMEFGGPKTALRRMSDVVGV